ncbi:MAG: hypothetical protein HQ592_16290 [Planctomycetes bacterium]|nr:hypothetical protein [Planctomycetota bacterium]
MDGQVAVLRPRKILVMGRAAAAGLLGRKRPGTETDADEWQGILCVPRCHPAAAMRFPRRDRQFRRDAAALIRMRTRRRT